MRARRILIVNADDFGLSEGVNAGIVRAHREGILTSATILANAPAFGDAVRRAGENPRLGVGLHLNIVRGRPLSPPEEAPLLLDARGNFRPFRVRKMTPRFLAQAEREYRAQFAKAQSAGVRLTHVDFEKHHAWQSPLYALAARLAAEHNVPGIRSLREPVWFSLRTAGWPGLRNVCMSAALRTGFRFGGERVKTTLFSPDCFFGQLHIGKMTEQSLLRLLANLPPGVSELMTHPGEPAADEETNMGKSWITSRRAAELSALISPAVREAVKARGIELRGYA